MADHTIEVKLNPDGTLHCVPDVHTVKPGETLQWIGPAHTGTFRGRVMNAAPTVLSNLQSIPAFFSFDSSKLPFQPTGWQAGTEVTVHPAAEPGSYKYEVTVGAVTIDPIIIIP